MIPARRSRPETVSLRVVRAIVQAACLSPSGDNCQPWRFRWDGERLTVLHDANRARHGFNAHNGASLIALGMVLESIRLEATRHGLEAVADLLLERGELAPWAEVFLFASLVKKDALCEAIEGRWTDRGLYQGGVLNIAVLEKAPVRRLSPVPDELLDYFARAETIVWRHPYLHRDLMQWIRFTRRASERTRDGLPWRTLGINFFQYLALCAGRFYPMQRLLNAFGMLGMVRHHVRKQIRSGAGVLCFTVRSEGPEALVQAGRDSLRVWLGLNAAGYGVQPLSQSSILPYLDAVSPVGISAEDSALLASGVEKLKRHLVLADEECVLWVWRVGLCSRSKERVSTPRRPVEAVLEITEKGEAP